MNERERRKRRTIHDPEIIRDRLKELFKNKEIRDAYLEQDGIVSAYSIKSYCRGDTYPNSQTLQSICSYFGVSADWVLGISSIKTLAYGWIWDSVAEVWRCPYCYGMGEPHYHYCPECGKQVNTS